MLTWPHVLAVRQITFYEDGSSKTVGPGRHMSGHKSDVLSMVLVEGSPTLVTSSDDGEIWVWNIDSGMWVCGGGAGGQCVRCGCVGGAGNVCVIRTPASLPSALHIGMPPPEPLPPPPRHPQAQDGV